MVKRAKVTAETFEKRPSAIDKLVGNDQEAREDKPVEVEQTPPVQAEPGGLKRTYTPTSFYLDDMQLNKLDDLAHEYKKRTGKRINRNDIVRALVEDASLNTLLNLIKE